MIKELGLAWRGGQHTKDGKGGRNGTRKERLIPRDESLDRKRLVEVSSIANSVSC
jgi:hypothetical protein